MLLLSFCSLALYIFYSNLYLDEQKSYPKYDLVIAAVLAFIWLCAASAWAHAVLGLRSIADVEVRKVGKVRILSSSESDLYFKCVFEKDRLNFISNIATCV